MTDHSSRIRSTVARLYTDRESAPRKGARPSIAFLVILNGLIFFAMGAVGNHVLGIIFFVPTTLFFMALSAVPQGLVRRFVERRYYLKPIPRTAAYLSPFALLFLGGLLLPSVPRAPNKQNPAPSPDGQYEARFRSPSPGWDIVVIDRKSGTTWKEETSFMPHLQIYWRWDADNRLWIYNSDDGQVHYLEATGDAWRLRNWGWGHAKHADAPPALTPPVELYPSYARED